jgi:hypothetical protein
MTELCLKRNRQRLRSKYHEVSVHFHAWMWRNVWSFQLGIFPAKLDLYLSVKPLCKSVRSGVCGDEELNLARIHVCARQWKYLQMVLWQLLNVAGSGMYISFCCFVFNSFRVRCDIMHSISNLVRSECLWYLKCQRRNTFPECQAVYGYLYKTEWNWPWTKRNTVTSNWKGQAAP